MIRVLYTLLGALAGVLALRTYEVSSRASKLEATAIHAANLAQTYQLLSSQCIRTLDRCKEVVEDSNVRFTQLSVQYDRVTQSCFSSNNLKPKVRMAQSGINLAGESLEGSGGPIEK